MALETRTPEQRGDADVAQIAALFADRTRAQVLLALADGRALPASVLADEDGTPTTERRPGDALSAPLAAHPYRLGPQAGAVFARIGVGEDLLTGSAPHRRPLLRFCLDWSEQRHHLGGRLGAAVLTALTSANWINRQHRQRAVQLTDTGAANSGPASASP